MSIKQGEYLKELRIRNNYSQEKLGELLGLSRQSVSKWEQGYATPDTDNLLKLSELYGISVDTLLRCGEDEQQPAEQEKIPTIPQEETEAVSEAKAEKPPRKKRGWFFISYPVITVIAYAIIGAKFNAVGWATGWIVLLTIPLFYTGVIAAEKKKPVIFCYPVLAVLMFLIGGFFYSLWHPLWIIFLTIPVFYIIAAKAGKNNNDKS